MVINAKSALTVGGGLNTHLMATPGTGCQVAPQMSLYNQRQCLNLLLTVTPQLSMRMKGEELTP